LRCGRQTRQFTIYFQKHGGDYVIAFYLNPTPENTSVSVQFEYDVVFDYGTVPPLCRVRRVRVACRVRRVRRVRRVCRVLTMSV
jgi:hypothetical protein